MDLVYLTLAGLLWLAVYGLARGCQRLHAAGQRP